MSTKQNLLKTLEENRGITFSGEQLASAMKVSRSAIWKAIKALKEEGYEIESVTNKGYCLKDQSDIMSPEGIRPWLFPENRELDINVYKTIGSTNQEAKKLALEGAAAGTVIISEEQTQGRGRMGRSFYSPPKSGIYLSLVLRPRVKPNEAVLLTTGASVGVRRAIKKVTGIDTQIKWVNDLYLNDLKISGILTEAVTNFENGQFEFVIIGIGVNFKEPDEPFPEELKEIAGALFHEKPDTLTRNRLAGEIINEVLEICNDLSKRDFLAEYKAHSLVLGKPIRVFRQEKWETAVARDINDDGGLVIKNESGEIETLNSGEISIRRMD
jgi:BirA family biotin operon repressor/biotin-[acetyl-CoA-carboxylase] ligase